MTLRYELTKKYHRKQIVPVCMASYQKYMTGQSDCLEHLIEGNIILIKPPVKCYQQYSHGICKPCMKEYYPQSYNSLKAKGRL
jgi:hypothetical protein